MTERLADIDAHIKGVSELGSVVNAMRGIAASRVQQARNQLAAVDDYAATIAVAIGQALALIPAAHPAAKRQSGQLALVLFCAEQGFAGAFTERVLNTVTADLGKSDLFLIGTRGISVLTEKGLNTGWHSAMPSHSSGIPKLADQIVEALYGQIVLGKIDRLDAVFSQSRPGQGMTIERRSLFPFDTTQFPAPENAPMLYLDSEALLRDLTADYLHAQLCNAALHAFAAENEARMEAMAAARSQIERQLSSLQATQRQVRQEEITAEIIELAAGETASRPERF